MMGCRVNWRDEKEGMNPIQKQERGIRTEMWDGLVDIWATEEWKKSLLQVRAIRRPSLMPQKDHKALDNT